MYISTHRYSIAYFPHYSGGYVPDYMDIWANPAFTTDITDESAAIMSTAGVYISYPLAGGSTDSGIYAEPFKVTERTPW